MAQVDRSIEFCDSSSSSLTINLSLRAQTVLREAVAPCYQHHQQQSEKTSHFRRSCPLIRNTSCAFKIEKS